MAVIKTAFAAAKTAYDKGLTSDRLTKLDIDGPLLELDIRIDAEGRPYLYFEFMAMSDLHLGTRQSRARRTAHMMEHTKAGKLYGVGDFFDGIHMVEKDEANYAAWHRQVVGHFLRKSEESDAIYIPGNHDIELRGKKIAHEGGEAWHRKLTGKTIFGIPVLEKDLYHDPKGRWLLIEHGDGFDDCVFGANKLFWYSIGDVAYMGLTRADVAIQNIPRFDGFSAAAKGKWVIKTVINEFMGVNKEISRQIDSDPMIDGVIYGHSHMGDLQTTAMGKLKLNSGCCTEHVQALVHDRHGTYALITWHKNSLEILEENGRRRKFTWDELGLGAFKKEPTLFKDKHTRNADRLVRLMDYQWPSRERQRAIEEARAHGTMPPPLPLPNLSETRRRLRRLQGRLANAQPVAA